MADEGLDYEAMLSALQGLLNEEVGVVVDVRYDGRLRPLVALRGILSSGTVAHLAELGGAELHYPGGEAVLFFVGSEHSWFVVRQDDFKRGGRKGNALYFETGRTQTYVTLLPPPLDLDS
jgi:hypothetical protein